MAVSPKTIKIRIRSIKNISKITKAMELVSATKMRKASRAAQSGRPYNFSAIEVMNAILKAGHGTGKFFEKKENPKKIAVLLFSSNRGLCGSFNTQVVNFARKSLKERFSYGESSANVEISWITVGKKGTKFLLMLGEKVIAEFPKAESREEAEEFFPVAKFLTDKFLDNTFDEVLLAFTDFVSPLKLLPRLNTLLPFANGIKKNESDTATQTNTQDDLLFEPNRDAVLNYLAPRFVEDKLYQALLESNASEHSARMSAMKNASDAAGDLIETLVFLGNNLRQASITREIAEIAGGKAAVES